MCYGYLSNKLTSYTFIYTFFFFFLDYVRGIGDWLPIASRGSDCEGPVPASASNGDCQPRHYCPSFKDVHGHRLQLRGIAVNTRLVTGVQTSSPNLHLLRPPLGCNTSTCTSRTRRLHAERADNNACSSHTFRCNIWAQGGAIPHPRTLSRRCGMRGEPPPCCDTRDSPN